MGQGQGKKDARVPGVRPGGLGPEVAEGPWRLLMARTYIYGVIPTGQSLTFGLSGFPPRPEAVYTVVYRDLGCVVSNYFGEDFASLSKETLLRCLMAHQTVIERVMK